MSGDDRRQYGSGAVFQRKDGMWIGRFEVGEDREGRRRRIQVSGTSETICKQRLKKKRDEIARNGVPEKGSAAKTTVTAWAKQWLEIQVEELRPNSYKSTASAVKVWIVPTLGRKRLETLTPADVRAVHAAMRRSARKESSQIRTHAVLMKMLKDAVREGKYVSQSVLLAEAPKPGETDEASMTVEQALAVLGKAASRPDATRWAAAILQAMRQGECLGLTRAAVDFDSHEIDISWQLQRLPYLDVRNKALGFRVPSNYVAEHLVGNFHLVRPKSTKSRRRIPMVPWMEDGLRALFDSTPVSEYGLVWTEEDGMPIDAVDDRARWHDLQASVDVAHPAGRPFKTHEMRHTTATLLLELGIPKDVVEAILGQSKFVIAYDHSDKKAKVRAALEQLAEQLALTSA